MHIWANLGLNKHTFAYLGISWRIWVNLGLNKHVFCIFGPILACTIHLEWLSIRNGFGMTPKGPMGSFPPKGAEGALGSLWALWVALVPLVPLVPWPFVPFGPLGLGGGAGCLRPVETTKGRLEILVEERV